MRSIAVVSNTNEAASSAAAEFCAKLESKGVPHVRGIPLSSLGSEQLTSCDTVFVFGGDGTILRTASKFTSASPLLVGVNYGRLGFLAEVSAGQAEQALQNVLSFRERFYVIQRLQGAMKGAESAERSQGAPSPPSATSPPCTNEIMVSPTAPSRLLTLELNVPDTLNYKGRLDAIIVSTALGSTAYSLSAGGPVVDPGSQAVLLTPVAPINMALRPMVIDNSKSVSITNSGREEALLFCDGIQWRRLRPGETVEIKRHTQPLRLYRTENNILEKLFKRRLT
ncbi:MAG: NAD(+)/NADH kinase [Thermoprotei archaeon]